MRKGIVFGCLLGSWVASALGYEVEIGGAKVELPEPPGMVRVDGLRQQADIDLPKLTPRSHQLLGLFGTEEALAKVLEDSLRPPGLYFFAQANREKPKSASEDFAEYATSIREREKAKSPETDKVWSDAEGPQVQVAEKQRLSLGVFHDAPNAIAYMYLHKNGVGAVAGVRARGQAILLKASGPYRGKADLLAVQERMRGWIAAIQAANPPD
jgi:hypothetical protein